MPIDIDVVRAAVLCQNARLDDRAGSNPVAGSVIQINSCTTHHYVYALAIWPMAAVFRIVLTGYL